MPNTPDFNKLPTHLAIVPDGNRRWAELRHLPRLKGHHTGADNMLRLIEYLAEYPIKFVTIYGFSTENWGRPVEEVEGLFDYLAGFMDRHLDYIHKKSIRLRHLGRLQQLPPKLKRSIEKAIDRTQDNTGLTLNIAFNYGGRAEIIDAVRKLVEDGVTSDRIDETLFEKYLYTAGLPPVDLLIRTGDEVRFSNFLIWQTAYSEYYLTDVLWPDFAKGDVDKALTAFSQRKRRFGAL